MLFYNADSAGHEQSDIWSPLRHSAHSLHTISEILTNLPYVILFLVAKAITQLRCYSLLHCCSVTYVDKAAITICPSQSIVEMQI